MLLNRYRDTGLVADASIQRGLRWVLGMQGKDGGWGAFDVDNNNDLANHIPFADHAAMIDPSTPNVTGRVLELLGQMGYGPSEEHVSRALAYLRNTQEKDGLWWGRWGVNYSYGTWSVLVGLRSVGVDMTLPYVRMAAESLKARQNKDGSWGECCESYADPGAEAKGEGHAITNVMGHHGPHRCRGWWVRGGTTRHIVPPGKAKTGRNMGRE